MMRTRQSMKKYKNEVTYCSCGGHYIKNNKKRHEKSLMHFHWIKINHALMALSQEDVQQMFGLID